MDTSSYGELGGKVKDCFRLGRGTLHLAGRIWGQIYTWDCKQLFLKACSHNCTIYIPHPYSYLVAEQLALILFQEDCLLQEELCQLFFFCIQVAVCFSPLDLSLPSTIQIFYSNWKAFYTILVFSPISHFKERKYPKARTSITFLKVSEIIIYVSVVNPFYPLKGQNG